MYKNFDKTLKAAELSLCSHTCNFFEKTFQKTKFIFVGLAVALFCAGAYATTDIQPNGNLAGGSTAANCTQPVLGTYSGSTNFEAKWRANTVPLRWYNEGNRITTVQDNAKTCDYDGVLNIPSTAPSRTGYTFGGWKVIPSLPAEYTELEYVQSTGTQYIDTGVIYNATKNITLYITAQSDVSPSGNHVALGFGGSSGQWFGVANSRAWTIGSGGVSTVTASNKTPDIKINWFNSKETLSIGNTLIGQRNVTASSKRLQLFGRNDSGSFQGKIYYARLFVDGILEHNFIPVKNSSNVVGMYDTVSGTFFTDAGGGTFTAGPALD